MYILDLTLWSITYVTSCSLRDRPNATEEIKFLGSVQSVFSNYLFGLPDDWYSLEEACISKIGLMGQGVLSYKRELFAVRVDVVQLHPDELRDIDAVEEVDIASEADASDEFDLVRKVASSPELDSNIRSLVGRIVED